MTAEMSLEAQLQRQKPRRDEPKIINKGNSHTASRDQVQKMDKSVSSANMTQSGSFVKLAAMNIEASNVQSCEPILNVARIDEIIKDIDEVQKSQVVLEVDDRHEGTATKEEANTKLQVSNRGSSPKTEHDLKTIEKIMMVSNFDQDLDQRIAMQQATSGRGSSPASQKGFLDQTFMDKSLLGTRKGQGAADDGGTLQKVPSLVIKEMEITNTSKDGLVVQPHPAASHGYMAKLNAATTPQAATQNRSDERQGGTKATSVFGEMLA